GKAHDEVQLAGALLDLAPPLHTQTSRSPCPPTPQAPQFDQEPQHGSQTDPDTALNVTRTSNSAETTRDSESSHEESLLRPVSNDWDPEPALRTPANTLLEDSSNVEDDEADADAEGEVDAEGELDAEEEISSHPVFDSSLASLQAGDA
ncbi:hypothetical protein H0H93_003220, partial [Arthromyces matolae]